MIRLAAELLVILLSAKLFGALAKRLRQPAVLGELIGGVVLGTGLFAFFHPDDPALAVISKIGVILLLFETGLHSDLARLLNAGPTASAVAAIGVVTPFALGWGLMTALGKPAMESVFVGAALTATSVGITARVLSDMDKLERPEAQIILGAAVIDDVFGIAILAAVQSVAASGSPHGDGALGAMMVSLAFIAGILLARAGKTKAVDKNIRPIAAVVVPIFFVMIGAKMNLASVVETRATLGLAVLLTLAAVAGKLVSALAVRGRGLNRWAVGFGMIPRGEVGLIFAQIGLASGIIEPPLYAALIAMAIATTFLAPPLLKRTLG